MTAKGAKGDQDGPIKDWASGKPPAAKACDEDGDDNDALAPAPAPAWHKYLGPLAVLFKAKKKKKSQKDWKTLRNERIAEEQAKEEEDERLKIEKREADRVLEVEEAKKRAAMKKKKGKIKKPKSGDDDDEEEEEEEDKDDDDDHGDDGSAAGGRGQASNGDSDDDDADGGDEKTQAARMVTKMIRGLVARKRYKKKFMKAIAANEGHYKGEVKARIARKQAISNRRTGQVAAYIFVRQYVVDLLDTSALFLVQSVAAVTLQSNFRGAITRKKLAYRPPERPSKAKLTRFTPQTIRRAWARSEFIPKGGWPGRASLVVEYDFREYKDRPPKGNTFGVKTPKVHANVRSQEELDILTENQYSWVGLPVQVEPQIVGDRNKLRRKQNLMLLEGASPFVGPQFVPPVIAPPQAQKGLTAIRGLGWREDMIDNRKVVERDGKRAYNIIDPYSSAALAADLATVVKNSDFTFTKSPSKLSERERNATLSSAVHHLGSSLEEKSVNSLSSFESSMQQSVRTAKSGGNRRVNGKIGLGVWDGSLTDHDKVSSTTMNESVSHLTSEDAEVIQLITPTRGYPKPLSSHRTKALAQAGLLPDQLGQTFELNQRQQLIDHEKTTIFEHHGKDKRLDKMRQKELVKQKHQGRVKVHSDQNLMENDMNWKRGINYRLVEGANRLAEELDDSVNLDDDPWSRSTYKPKKEYTGKVVVWKKKPPEYYKYKYQWLPQTMLKQSVLDVYPDKRAPTHVRQQAYNDSISASQDLSRSPPRNNMRKSKVKGGRNAKIIPADDAAKVTHPYSFSP
jgi:hypothetical protein